MELGLSIFIIVILLILSAFFSGSETSLTAASKARLHSWEKEGNKKAALANKIREQKDRMIGALLLGNNLVNIMASALATSVLIKIFGEAGVIYATFVMTLLVLILSEVMPKTYAFHHADKMALIIAPFVNVVIIIFSPVTNMIAWLVRSILKFFGADVSKVSAGSHVEVLRGVIDLHEGEDEVLEQRAMLRSILDLDDVTVEEVMIHRQNMQMLCLDNDISQVIEEALSSSYSRLPLYRGEQDNIVGILHIKALVRALNANKSRKEDIDLEDLAAEPWFIPDSTTLYDQLQSFRARREHFAVVVDEYGSLMGMVTLEDILEEIVGDISDEHDAVIAGVRRQSEGVYLIDGSVTIRDLNREFEWDLPDEHYSTLAGLIIHEAKVIPEAGQSFTFYDFKFDIIRRKKNQITLIRTYAAKQ